MEWKRFMEVEKLSFQDEDELLNELYKHMFIVAYAKTRSKSDALDIVQESWIKILMKLDTLKDAEKLIQWAKVIVANTAINSVKRRSVSMVPLIDEQMRIGDLGADLHLEDKELKRAVYEGLSVLDEETRKIMICKFYFDWKDGQIAEVMEMPVGTVKAKIHRAKARLKIHLADEFGSTRRHIRT